MLWSSKVDNQGRVDLLSINKRPLSGVPVARPRRTAARVMPGGVALTVAAACAVIGFGASAAAAAPPAPVNLHTFTGGPSIALLWKPGSGTEATYRVYRNGT